MKEGSQNMSVPQKNANEVSDYTRYESKTNRFS